MAQKPDLMALLGYWQKLLRLQDWTIEVTDERLRRMQTPSGNIQRRVRVTLLGFRAFSGLFLAYSRQVAYKGMSEYSTYRPRFYFWQYT